MRTDKVVGDEAASHKNDTKKKKCEYMTKFVQHGESVMVFKLQSHENNSFCEKMPLLRQTFRYKYRTCSRGRAGSWGKFGILGVVLAKRRWYYRQFIFSSY
jgi:hypothetical protein